MPPRIVLAIAIAAWTAAAAVQWVSAPPLGHDEAQYTIAAQDWLAGAPLRWPYLSSGMSIAGVPGVLAGGGELALRIVPALLGLAFLLVAARVAYGVGGAVTAAWSAAVIAASLAIAKHATSILGDLPATACLLAGIAILATEILRDGGLRWRFVLVAPCFAGAFYLRYGSVLVIAVIGAAALAVGWRPIARRPWIVLAAIAVFAALLVPHVRQALGWTGSPLGLLREYRTTLTDAYPGQSLVAYATANPLTYYGIAATPALLAGLAAIHRWRDRRIRLLWLIAVGTIVAVGLMPVAQSRYIYLGIALLIILGVDAIVRWIGAAGPRARRALGAAAIAVVAGSWIAVAHNAIGRHGVRVRGMAGTLAAVPVLRADAAGAPCHVFARHTAQLQWYSGCVAVWQLAPEIVAHERVYVVFEPGKPYQPDLAGLPGVTRVLAERPGVVTVMRLEPKP